MNFCTNCGNELREGVKFCPSCGNTVQSPTQQQSQESQSEAPAPPPADVPRQVEQDPVQGAKIHSNIVQRVINIITKPKSEWQVIAGEKPDIMKLLVGYALILAAIPALASFLKFGVIGITYWGHTTRSVMGGINQALIQLISAVVGAYLLAWVIDLLAPTFSSEKNFGKSLQLSVYSSTPQWIAGILFLLGTGFSALIVLIGLYAIYLLAVGMPIIKRTPKDKVVGYVVVTIVAMILIYFVVALIIGPIVGLVFAGKKF